MIAVIFTLVVAFMVLCVWVTWRETCQDRMRRRLRWYWHNKPRELRRYLDGITDHLPHPEEID